MTSWIRVRGFWERINDGISAARMVAAKDLLWVAGTFDRGRSRTSNVESDGFSAASLTSIGPETDARAAVSPAMSISHQKPK